MKYFINNIIPHNPKYIIPQDETIKWLKLFHSDHMEELIEKYSIKKDLINSRSVYSKGIGNFEPKSSDLFNIQTKINPNLTQRSKHNQAICEEMINDLFRTQAQAPDHINHITCSHYQSPSAAQKLVIGKEWHEYTKVTHLYHMGCYAALPAMRVAKSYVADGASRVDNVHTEVCSSHIDKDDESIEQIIMKTLFSDGAIKYSIVNEDEFSKSKEGFEILSHHEELVPNSNKDMSWELGENSFMMTLSRRVPIYLAKKIEDFLSKLYERADLSFNEEKENTVFALHPGGPKIIDLIQKKLELNEDQVINSINILQSRGNMSSATLPHIWKDILDDQNVKDDNLIATIAFGPGLTITGALLRLCK